MTQNMNTISLLRKSKQNYQNVSTDTHESKTKTFIDPKVVGD